MSPAVSTWRYIQATQEPGNQIKNAYIIMYRAKGIGSNNSQFYAAAMNGYVLEWLPIEGDLRAVLELY